jgi:hypothetical protein
MAASRSRSPVQVDEFRGRAPYPDRDETAGRLRRSDAAGPAGRLLFFGGVRYVAYLASDVQRAHPAIEEK